MTRKNVRHIPTEAELVDRLDSQAVRAMFMENWPGKKRPKQADVEGFMKYALADARIYIRDALKHTPKQVPGTDEPLGTPIEEATTDFSRNLQITYTNWTGRLAPFTATNGWRGSSGKILREYLHLLGAPFNATRWINELQDRSNKMTWRPTARPGGLCVPRYFRRILSGADGVVPGASSATTIYVAVYTPLEARLAAHGRIAAHLAEAMLSEFHTSSGHFEINLSRKTRAAVDRWAPRR